MAVVKYTVRDILFGVVGVKLIPRTNKTHYKITYIII